MLQMFVVLQYAAHIVLGHVIKVYCQY